MLMTSHFNLSVDPFYPGHNVENVLLFRHALVRIAGIPMATVDSLRCSRTVELISEITEIEKSRESLTNNLVDRLHDHIGQLESQNKYRLELVHIKRSVFNGRLFTPSPELFATISEHNMALALDLRQWLVLKQRALEKYQEAEAILEEEHTYRQELLKAIVRQPLFRSGLELANPLLGLNLDKFLTRSGPMNRRGRLAERSVLRYLYRTACKTSPFSTFTTVASGVLGTGSADDCDISALTSTIIARPELNIGILAHIAHRLEDSPNIIRGLRVRLTTAWKRHDGHIRYLRNVIGIAHGVAIEMSVAHELFDLPCNPFIEIVIDLLSAEPDQKIEDLADQLMNRLDIGSEETFEFLRRLLKLNFLVADGMRPSSLGNSLTQFCDRLDSIDNEECRTLGSALSHVDSILSKGSFSPFLERQPVLANISLQLKKAYEQVGLPATMLPKTLVYEDVASMPAEGAVKLPTLDKHVHDLALFQRLLSLFNQYQWLRAGMTAYFVQKYGVRGCTIDVLSFAIEFVEEYQKRFWDDQWASKSNHIAQDYSHSTELERIHSARLALVEYIRQQVEMQQDAEQIQLNPDELNRIVSSLECNSFLTNSFFVQIQRRGSDFDLVLNKVYSGLGHMFSRFSSLLSKADESIVPSLRSMLKQLQPKGAVFAQIRGGINTNLNIHPELCEYEFCFPGDTHEVAPQSRITLDDLRIEHNETQSRLMLLSSRLNCEVIPVYHGFLVPGALPAVQHFMLNFSPIYSGNTSLVSLCELNIGTTPLVVPRIVLGHLILERKTWYFRLIDLPVPLNEQSELAYYLAVYRWKRQHGIPDRVFVRIDTTQAATEQSNEQETENDFKFSRKPTYIDFASLFSVQQFRAAVAKLSAMQVLAVTEMSPSPDDIPSGCAQNTVVSEIILDLNQRGGN